MASGEQARVRIRVSGRVQGVGYRFFTVEEAAARSLVGYSRNLPDGDVEVVAEGPRAALAGFLESLRHGPRAASVTRVAPEWEAARGEFTEFTIRS